MFVPEQYREQDSNWMLDIVRSNPLALMASDGTPEGCGPAATHLPCIPDPSAPHDWSDGPRGAVLLGHMNRANPQWRHLHDGQIVLLVFTGPHAYVSPAVYDTTPAAPTWDFTAVHVHGVVTKLEPHKAERTTLDVVTDTVTALEGRFGAGWDMTDSIEYFHRLLPGVGAFRVRVGSAEGMFKLSQEQPSDIRDRVRCHFAAAQHGRSSEIAHLMTTLDGH